MSRQELGGKQEEGMFVYNRHSSPRIYISELRAIR
jgi:hypothetical protein